MQIYKSPYTFVFIQKQYPEDIPFLILGILELHTHKVCEIFVYKHAETIAYFLRKIQTLRVNNSRILSIKNAKFSGYYFYMNLNI